MYAFPVPDKDYAKLLYKRQIRYNYSPDSYDIYPKLESLKSLHPVDAYMYYYRIFMEIRMNISNIPKNEIYNTGVKRWRGNQAIFESPRYLWKRFYDEIYDAIEEKHPDLLISKQDMFTVFIEMLEDGRLRGCSVYPVFPLIRAIQIIERFISDSSEFTVFDPFAEFGSRMLACKAVEDKRGVKISYTCYVPWKQAKKAFNQMISDYGVTANAQFCKYNTIFEGSYDLVFTSILPYDIIKSINNKLDPVVCKRYNTIEEWHETYLLPTLQGCLRVMKTAMVLCIDTSYTNMPCNLLSKVSKALKSLGVDYVVSKMRENGKFAGHIIEVKK